MSDVTGRLDYLTGPALAAPEAASLSIKDDRFDSTEQEPPAYSHEDHAHDPDRQSEVELVETDPYQAPDRHSQSNHDKEQAERSEARGGAELHAIR